MSWVGTVTEGDGERQEIEPLVNVGNGRITGLRLIGSVPRWRLLRLCDTAM